MEWHTKVLPPCLRLDTCKKARHVYFLEETENELTILNEKLNLATIS